MMYLAHIGADGREQTVRDHLLGTSKLSAEYGAHLGCERLAELVGLLHDIGKYSDAFQNRLAGGSKVDHSTAGAFVCAKIGQPFAAFCIAGHHSGLPDAGSRTDTPDMSTLQARLKRGQRCLIPSYEAWKTEIDLPHLPPQFPSDPISDSFFIRMLFSCLVDADYLDTERFMSGKSEDRSTLTDIDILYGRFMKTIAGWFPPTTELNQKRCIILRDCLRKGETSSPGLKTLTVPTGGGKTTASLGFALSHAKANHLRRIIYVIPYKSIIEQTAEIFRGILGEEVVLEHHSDYLFDSDDSNDSPQLKRRLLLATENWEFPVIVTTAVQFFESLYSNRPSRCRKLHNLAESVIIFDEAQMLPLEYLRPCISGICQLVKHYKVTAVLCTATQPALNSLFKEFAPSISIEELCPSALFTEPVFRRVTIRSINMNEKISISTLAGWMNKEQAALCIVNERKTAIEVYEHLEEDGRYHLSTLMYPLHRQSVLSTIRNRLSKGLPCRVVSTSLIEAGVDVDFPTVFREEAGLDSILQAAGRCNRNGKRPAAKSLVTVFRLEDTPNPHLAEQIGAMRSTISRFDDILSKNALDNYFSELLDFKGSTFLDKMNILHEDCHFNFRTVADHMHLISADNYTVYIPIEDGKGLVDTLRTGNASKDLLRKLELYSVQVYKTDFDRLSRFGVLDIILGCKSAILTDLSFYSRYTGLMLNTSDYNSSFV